MQETLDYNFLIIGRSGAGKSATTKMLTGDPSITVANSLKEVTTDVQFYRGMYIELGIQNDKPVYELGEETPSINRNAKKVRFSVLDIPGLDRLNSRFKVRQQLLQILQSNKISLHGILYVTSLTERDTLDCNKLFKFVQQLPWSDETKKGLLVPILTKYDNLIIDSPEEEIGSIKEQYGKMFEAAGYEQAWGKRVYWVNHTKSLQFKIKIRQQIKEVYEKQIERLLDVVKKSVNNGRLLTADSIRKYIEEEDIFIAKSLLEKIAKDQIPCRRQIVEHHVCLKIIVRPKKFYQSVTTVSASSIGMILSQLCKNQIPTALSMVLTGIPIALAFLNLVKSTTKMAGKGIHQNHEKALDKSRLKFQNICKQINDQLLKQWKLFNESLQFFLEQKILYCRLNPVINQDAKFIFIDPLSFLQLRIGERPFQKVWKMDEDPGENINISMHYPLKLPNIYLEKGSSIKYPVGDKEKLKSNENLIYPCLFKIDVPQFEDQNIWQPDITIQCGLKVFDEEILLKFVQNDRIMFDKAEEGLIQKMVAQK